MGAGGFGREVYGWILDSKACYPDWNIVGFLDDNPNALDKYDYDGRAVSSISDYAPQKNDYLVLALGSPKLKRKVVTMLEARGGTFLSFAHRTTIIGRNVLMGKGCILCPHSVLTCDITLGDFVTVNCFSGAGHDVRIGSFSTLSGHVDITGFATIGADVLIGSNASILPGVTVGENSVVGAGSIVIRNVKRDTTVFGNPAKVIF